MNQLVVIIKILSIRNLIELPHIIEHLGLKVILHPDTSRKFRGRIEQTILDLVLLQTTARTGIKKLVLGQDGTGVKVRSPQSVNTLTA